MSQIGSGNNTTTHQLPRRFWLATMAALAWWILTAVAAVLDITDGFPRGLIALAAAGAGTLTIGTMFIHAGAKRAELVEALGRLEAMREGDREAIRKDMVEAVAAVYRRGMVNGVPQIAEEAGRPTLRRVSGGDG